MLKAHGKIVLVLPDKEYTFDVKRPYTSFEHLLEDYENKTTENDATHFEEVIKLHESAKDRTRKLPGNLQRELRIIMQSGLFIIMCLVLMDWRKCCSIVISK